MGTKITRNLPNNAYQAAVDANGPSSANPYATIADLGGTDGDTLLISGGASYSGTGLTFDVSILVFKISGIQYTTPAETTITLAAGDPTFARFDAIIATLDASDNPIVDVVQGTPSATPVTPALSADQVLVQYVDIQAASTTPNITIQQVYREDQTSDWLGSVSGGFGNAAVFSSPTPPASEGSFCCLNTVGRYGIRRGTRFTAPTAVNRSQYTQLSFRIYLVDDFIANYVTYIRVFGYSALPTDEGGTGIYLGLIDVIPYMDLTAVGQWQLVTVPTGLMDQNLSVSEIGFLNFTVYNCPPALDKCGGTALKNNSGNLITLQYAIDDVKLQTGAAASPGTPTVDVLENTLPVGSTRTLDFQDGNNTTVDVTENLVDDTIEVKYNVASSYFGTVNGRSIVEITSTADLPFSFAGDTTYVIRGQVTVLGPIQIFQDGTEIVGLSRDTDELIYTGTGSMIQATDANFTIRDLKFSCTNINGSILSADNINAGSYNSGRLKTALIENCQFRGTYDVMDIVGYDLVDINNCLFFYIKAQNFGLRFEDTSKIQITSCELIRWFDETTIPTPSGWATCSMIELKPTNIAPFGAVNINGCVIHPQQTQNGIEISAASTTGFGTISSNAFVNVGLTTGRVFLPEIPVLLLPDYSQPETIGYDVFANQGILNSVSGTVMTVTGNTTDTALTTGVHTVINTGGLATQQAGVRFTVTTGGRCTYIGTKQKFVSIHATIAYQKQGGGTDSYNFHLYKNGVLLPGSDVEVISGGATADGSIPLMYGTLMELNDYIEIYVINPVSGDDILIKDVQLVIRE